MKTISKALLGVALCLGLVGGASADLVEIEIEYKTYPSMLAMEGEEIFTTSGTLSFDLTTCKMWRNGSPVDIVRVDQCDGYGLAVIDENNFITVRRKSLNGPFRYERFARSLKFDQITVGLPK